VVTPGTEVTIGFKICLFQCMVNLFVGLYLLIKCLHLLAHQALEDIKAMDQIGSSFTVARFVA